MKKVFVSSCLVVFSVNPVVFVPSASAQTCMLDGGNRCVEAGKLLCELSQKFYSQGGEKYASNMVQGMLVNAYFGGAKKHGEAKSKFLTDGTISVMRQNCYNLVPTMLDKYRNGFHLGFD